MKGKEWQSIFLWETQNGLGIDNESFALGVCGREAPLCQQRLDESQYILL